MLDNDIMWLSCGEIALRYNLNAETLRRRLQRLMRADDTSFREITNRHRNEPKYLFHVLKVRSIIAQMRGETSDVAQDSERA